MRPDLTGQTPPILSYVGRPDHYILALDETGLGEVPPPEELRALFPSWTEMSSWDEKVDATDKIVDEDKAAVVGAYIEARTSGYAACVVRTKSGHSYVVRLFDEMERYGSVIVIFGASDIDPPSIQLDGDEPKPLRLVHRVSLYGMLEEIDDATRIVLGWDDSVIGQSVLLWGHPDEANVGLEFWSNVLANPFSSHRTRSRLRTAEGDYRWFESTALSREPGKESVEFELIDITAHIDESAPVVKEIPLLKELAAVASVGVLIVDSAAKVQVVNALFGELLGSTSIQEGLSNNQTAGRGTLAELIQETLKAPTKAAEPQRAPIATPRGIIMTSAKLIDGPQNEPYVFVTAELDQSSLPRDLPKGLSVQTMSAVLGYMSQAEECVTFKELAKQVGVSEVTARRYLTFLVKAGRAEIRPEYRGSGRPRHTYQLTHLS